MLAIACAGCNSAPSQKPVNGAPFQAAELAQGGPNRVANLAMRDNLVSLSALLDKLYKRNPAQWHKSGAESLEAARNTVMFAISHNQPLPIALGKQSVAALSLAFDPTFTGDRAGVLVYGLGSMLVQLYGGRTDLFLVQGLDAQQVANAAHNFEVAAWLLASKRDAQGHPLLVSNELSADGRNISFEREFGRILGRLELLAEMTDEKYRRSAIDYAQSLVAGPFLQFLPVSAVQGALQSR